MQRPTERALKISRDIQKYKSNERSRANEAIELDFSASVFGNQATRDRFERTAKATGEVGQTARQRAHWTESGSHKRAAPIRESSQTAISKRASISNGRTAQVVYVTH